jgi:uroporphyrinogen decarboxylase
VPEYTGRDRIRAAFKRQYADRVPIYPITGRFNARVGSITIREFLTEPAKMAQAILKFYEMFNPDICLVMGDMLYEVEACGTELEFPEDSLCREKAPLLENKANLAKLEIPDPKRDGRLPSYLEACERVSSVVKGSNVSGVACGPWQIAVLLRGAEELIRDTFKDPQFTHELMKFTSKVAERVILAQSELGIGISFSEAACSLNLISPSIYKNFVLPYHREIVNHCKERKVGLAMHICGRIDAIMEDVVSTGITAISIDEASSLKKMMEVAKGRAVVIGNVSVRLFHEGTKDEMEKAVKNCIEIAAKDSGYILASGCELSEDSLIENVRNFFEAGCKYGSYNSLRTF